VPSPRDYGKREIYFVFVGARRPRIKEGCKGGDGVTVEKLVLCWGEKAETAARREKARKELEEIKIVKEDNRPGRPGGLLRRPEKGAPIFCKGGKELTKQEKKKAGGELWPPE